MDTDQRRPLPKPHSPPKLLENESDPETFQEPVITENTPQKLKNSSLNSNRLKKVQSFHLTKHSCAASLTLGTPIKSNSLEHRLQGATSAVKHLEKELRHKNESITKLQTELNEKNRALDAYHSQIFSTQTLQKSSQLQSSLTSVIRKKEKELEKIVKNQQTKMEEDKKTLARLQELNKNLVEKIKEQEKKSKK